MIRIKDPLCITSRLLPGVSIGGATISIGYADCEADDRRIRYQWYIDDSNPGYERTFQSDDLQSGAGGGTLQEGMESLLSFLVAFAEARNPAYLWFTKPENYNLFPAGLADWAIQNADEFSTLENMLTESPGEYIIER